MGVMLAFVLAILAKLLHDEFKAWSPRLVDRLIRKAVARLPGDQRERLDEEWRSHINDTPGDLWKLIEACGYLRVAGALAPIRTLGEILREFRKTVKHIEIVLGVIGGICAHMGGVWIYVATQTFGNLWSLALALSAVGITCVVIAGGLKTALDPPILLQRAGAFFFHKLRQRAAWKK